MRLIPFALAAAVTTAHAQPPRPIPFDEVARLPAPPADHRLSYGDDPLQFGELRLPAERRGPLPVVVLVHGGCWQGAYDIAHTRPMADALAREGFAVWSIEYRRIGNPGGGWPNTFTDVARGTDFLRTIADRFALDLTRVVAMGHSAGGQLVLWLGTRATLDASSPVRVADPLPLRGIVALAPITDLARYGAAPGGCNSAVHQLMGGTPAEWPDRYAAVDPLSRLPLTVPTRLVHGSADRTVLPEQSSRLEAAAQRETVRTVLIPDAAHFDVIAPISPAWPRIVAELRTLAGR
ncbi:MAG: alpha/beta hydrolase [Gemmatimonadaceae bacterium]|nr:alpha/beta hydrolase [Gemmatimonadaceae bacterium]